jgi:hypothetical protein
MNKYIYPEIAITYFNGECIKTGENMTAYNTQASVPPVSSVESAYESALAKLLSNSIAAERVYVFK